MDRRTARLSGGARPHAHVIDRCARGRRNQLNHRDPSAGRPPSRARPGPRARLDTVLLARSPQGHRPRVRAQWPGATTTTTTSRLVVYAAGLKTTTSPLPPWPVLIKSIQSGRARLPRPGPACLDTSVSNSNQYTASTCPCTQQGHRHTQAGTETYDNHIYIWTYTYIYSILSRSGPRRKSSQKKLFTACCLSC